jgi:hypothetical protein
MFALARTADIVRNDRRVRKVPLSDSLRQKRPLDHLVARGEMLRIGRLDDIGTRATAARPTVLPIRILQLFPVAHLVYVPTMPRAENPPRGREHLEFDC